MSPRRFQTGSWITDLLARLLARRWDERVPGSEDARPSSQDDAGARTSRADRAEPQQTGGADDAAPTGSGAAVAGPEAVPGPAAGLGPEASPGPEAARDAGEPDSADRHDAAVRPDGAVAGPAARASAEGPVASPGQGRDRPSPAPRARSAAAAGSSTAPSHPRRAERRRRASGTAPAVTTPVDLERVEAMVTGPLGYGVQRHVEEGHPCLLGTWDSYPFVIEVPEEHDGWLLVSGDWEEPAAPAARDELASSVNDWNRDKYFPTVALVDTPAGPLIRATYLADLRAGVTDDQLRLHLDTALSACTQALTHVRPLLPDL